MKIKRSDAKQWARENYNGLEGDILPSFTSDMAQLDEDSIRHDVRYFVSQGFFSILCIVNACGMTFEERMKFVRIVAEEAAGKILVSVAIAFDTIHDSILMLQNAEHLGCNSAMLGYPGTYNPRSEDDIYSITKTMCDSTHLPLNILASSKFGFGRFHPSTFNPKLLIRIADIENVVAMKIGITDPGFTFDCFRLFGDKILVNDPLPQNWPITVTQYGQQWAGAGPYDRYQTPENQHLVKHFQLLREGQLNEAMDIYWKLAPVRNLFIPSATTEFPYTLWKYYQWLVGGNGGLLRLPASRLTEHDKVRVRSTLKSVGIIPREPDEEFYIGRVNYGKDTASIRRVQA